MPGLYALHAGFRMRWYMLAGGRALLRHWQWLLVAGLVVPGVPIVSLVAMPSQLLVAIVSPGVDWPARLAALATVQVLALLWIVPQRKSVSGGDFAPYLATLPISRLTQRLVDLTLLLTADFFPLLAFGLAMAVLWNHGRDGIAEAVALFIVLETVLAAQTLILHARPVVLLALALTDALLTLGLAPGGQAVVWLALALSMILPIAGALVPGQRAWPWGFQVERARRATAGASRKNWIPPALHVQLKALAARPGSSAVRLATAFGLALAADRLAAAFQFDERALPMAIVAMALIALALSGAYRLLGDAHAPFQAFLVTLPLPRSYWPVRDTAFVMLLGLPPLLLVVGCLGLNGLASFATLFMLMAASLALLALLRLPLAWGGRLGTLLGVLIAAGWAGTAIAAVVR